MPYIYTIGEALLDIIFRAGGALAATPGGAMLNTAVSLGRCGAPVAFIGELGGDATGDRIVNALAADGVDTTHLIRYNGRKSAVAIAELDSRGDAQYSFYKDMPEDRMKETLPLPETGDVVLFGSFFALTAAVREPLVNFLKVSRARGALVMYDPNFRRPHLPELSRLLPFVRENLSLAHIVRGSDEDFSLLFGIDTADAAWELVRSHGVKVLFYTRSDHDATLITDRHRITVPVPPVTVVSTVGAGDSFNAGVLLTLHRAGVTADGIEATDIALWERALRTGIAFGSHVCTHAGNAVTAGFALTLR
ncbi:MAG TPA: carbohydrate kinase [bacterium]|nr:carbohydrate kinase [bacterium]